jgi:nucleotide-binding universal stress UspA family protein
MKSILLYANQDQQLESRLGAAIDLTRHFAGRLTCLQVTPFNSFITGDPMGGLYVLPSVVEHVTRVETEHREQLEERLRREGIEWTWLRLDGTPEQVLVDRAILADLVVLSLPDAEQPNHEPSLHMIGSAATAVRGPVLGVPAIASGFRPEGPALIAWNSSAESAHALRLSMPLLKEARSVHVVTILDGSDLASNEGAVDYLVRHGVNAHAHEIEQDGRQVSEMLLEAATRLDAAWIVVGAYGHSRYREALLGGTTRELLSRSSLPLLLAH